MEMQQRDEIDNITYFVSTDVLIRDVKEDLKSKEYVCWMVQHPFPIQIFFILRTLKPSWVSNGS